MYLVILNSWEAISDVMERQSALTSDRCVATLHDPTGTSTHSIFAQSRYQDTMLSEVCVSPSVLVTSKVILTRSIQRRVGLVALKSPLRPQVALRSPTILKAPPPYQLTHLRTWPTFLRPRTPAPAIPRNQRTERRRRRRRNSHWRRRNPGHQAVRTSSHDFGAMHSTSVMCRRSFTAALGISMAYGIPIQAKNDPFVQIAEDAVRILVEAATPGKFLVNLFPWMKYIPAWFPGAGWKRQAIIWREFQETTRTKAFGEGMKAWVSLRAVLSYSNHSPFLFLAPLCLVLFNAFSFTCASHPASCA